MAFLLKQKQEIINRSLRRLQTLTPITATAPGTIARTLVEVVAEELGDFYEIVDFNYAMGFISTARGSALDQIALLFGTKRKTLSDIQQIQSTAGAFYFYIDTPIGQDITIPGGTTVLTDADSFVGRQLAFETVGNVTLLAGNTKVFATIRPTAADGLFSVGKNTLITHSYTGAPVLLKCINPKEINANFTFESDADFRGRIVREIRTIASANDHALRFNALKLDGVRDVKVRSSGFGLGTVDVLVVAQDTSNEVAVANRVRIALDGTRAAGITLVVRTPVVLRTNMDIGVILRPSSVASRTQILENAKNAATFYLDSLSVQDPLVYYQLIGRLVDAHQDIADVVIGNLTVDNRPVLRANYYPSNEEQIAPGTITTVISS